MTLITLAFIRLCHVTLKTSNDIHVVFFFCKKCLEFRTILSNKVTNRAFKIRIVLIPGFFFSESPMFFHADIICVETHQSPPNVDNIFSLAKITH